MRLTASYHTLGCKLNYAETSTYARQLAAYGVRRVGLGVTPDVVVLNSCAVTEHAQHKCRQLLHRMRRANPNALIVLTGCYAELSAPELYAEGADLLVRRADKMRLAALVAQRLGAEALSPACANGGEQRRDEPFFSAYSHGDRARAFLKVQDGCSYGCAYCTISRARGGSRSDTIASIVAQAEAIAKGGTQEVVLTGVNTGDFGANTGESFIDLLRRLEGVEGIARYRISSIEPNLLTDEVLELMASSRKYLPHLHVPLQSGSNELLFAMRRRYTTAIYWERIAAARARMPDLFLGVDVIVGFPGETPATFRETYEFLERLAPSFLHVFPYSKRPHTQAASMDGHVSPRMKRGYARELAVLSATLHASYAERFVGTTRRVLVERVGRDGVGEGFTDNYLRVHFPCTTNWRGAILDVHLKEHMGGGILRGEHALQVGGS